MKAIKTTTRAAIKAYLEVFIENLVKTYKNRPLPTLGNPKKYLAQVSAKGQLKPFHAAIIPQALLRISEFERGFSSALGTTFEECARLIACDHHEEAVRSYDIKGEASIAAINEIERQVSAYERKIKGVTGPKLLDMISSVLAARRKGKAVTRSARADLYIRSKDSTEYFFEIKSPMPNKGQCLEMTQRLLRFHLLRGQPRPRVQAYFSMAYNPYGASRSDYRWSNPRIYMPFEHGVLIGNEFWSIVGGPTTLKELLEIYQEVGHDKTKYMVDALAFGF